MSQLDLDALREEFLNIEFEERSFELEADKIAEYAKACGELAPRYTDPSDPDFQAPPTFASSLQRGRGLPDNFPKLPGLGMDAGKAMESMKPIRPGRLSGKTHLHDVYAKTGRSGRMIFMVTRMALFDDEGTHLANADTSIVIREKPTEEDQS
ncbi:MAG: MaoC family dehydratase N-terminal domain-containing protein [Pseudomonadales bacterium]